MTITKQEFDAALDKLGALYEEGKDCLNSMMIHHPQDIDARTRVHEIIRDMRDMMGTQLQARLVDKDAKKDMEEIHNESMYVMVAPDGNAQLTTLAPDFAMSLAMINVMADIGYSKPWVVLTTQGYKVLPVRVTITQDGDENKAFQKGNHKA